MKFLTSTLAFALLIGAGLPASAESTPTPSAMPPAMNVVGVTPLSATIVTYREIAYGERASKLLGSTVYNDEKQAIGKVSELIINPHDSVSMVVVSVGGFLGLGAKDVAISAKYFTFAKNRAILPHATKQVLQNLPAFRYSH